MASCDEVFAEPMRDTEQYLEKYRQQLMELDRQNLLPNLNTMLKYKVYSIQGSRFGSHKSIVLTTNDEQFVSVELGFIEIDDKKHIYPVTEKIDKALKPKMKYLGTIEATGEDLIGKAVAVMKRFGSYFKYCKNCQNFCNMYIEAIGLKQAQTLTDGDKAAIIAIIGGIIAFLFALMRWLDGTIRTAAGLTCIS